MNTHGYGWSPSAIRENLWLDLTQDHDGVFDEAVDCGKHVRTALDRHANHDDQTQHNPRQESNSRSITDEQAGIRGGEFDQTPDSNLYARRVFTSNQKRR